jgi:hypothetical protein
MREMRGWRAAGYAAATSLGLLVCGYSAAFAEISVGLRTGGADLALVRAAAASSQPDGAGLMARSRQFRDLAALSIPAVLGSFDASVGLDHLFGASAERLKQSAWQIFFAGAVPLVPPVTGSSSTVFFYNPVFDAAAITQWRFAHGFWSLASASVATGGRLRGEPVGALPSWVAVADRPFADTIMGTALATRAHLATGASGTDADRDATLARILVFQRALIRVKQDPALRAPAAALGDAMVSGQEERLRAAGLDPASVTQFLKLPAALRQSLVSLGAVSTADGAVVIVGSSDYPGILYLVAVSRTGGPPMLTSVAILPALIGRPS